MVQRWEGEITVGEPLVLRVEIDDLDIDTWAARFRDPDRVPAWVANRGSDDLPVTLLEDPRKGETATARPANADEAAAGIWIVGRTRFVAA